MVHWLLARGALTTGKDEDQKTPVDLAPNRRTLVAFPGHVDPVDVSAQQIGVMPLEVEEMNLLNLDARGKLISPSKRTATRLVRHLTAICTVSCATVCDSFPSRKSDVISSNRVLTAVL